MKKPLSFLLLISLLLSAPLSGCSGAEESAWQKGQKALAEENYGDAVADFGKAGSGQDAEQLLSYSQASLDLENGEYAKAEAGFRALGDFKDCVLMSSYCRAREREAAAFSAGDADAAVGACAEAYQLYTDLTLFRDSDDRAANCRELLYSKATEWMNLGRDEAASTAFSALGGWRDSAELEKYCKASVLESQGSFAAAAELFSEIPEILDSGVQADSAYEQAYLHAADLMEQGDHEAALNAFAELGDYRDAKEQMESTSVLQIRSLLRAGSYSEALEKLNLLSDDSAFPQTDFTEGDSLRAFLDGFVNAWMSAHAGIMQAFFGCSLLQPYLEPGGELDTLVRAELTDETAPQNYGFVFHGTEVQKLLVLDNGFTLAKVKGLVSYSGPEGYVEKQEDIQVLLDTRQGTPVAAAVYPLPAAGGRS